MSAHDDYADRCVICGRWGCADGVCSPCLVATAEHGARAAVRAGRPEEAAALAVRVLAACNDSLRLDPTDPDERAAVDAAERLVFECSRLARENSKGTRP